MSTRQRPSRRLTVPGDKPVASLRVALRDLATYSRFLSARPLHPYQVDPGEAIVRAVRQGRGGTFSVVMSRQAGKNELSAQLEAYLLTLNRSRSVSIVKAAPTFRPQGHTSMIRLKDTLGSPLVEIAPFDGEFGHVLRLQNARAFFLSAEPGASVVGATASLLLEIDEAQDVDPDKHDRDFAPMAAATNAVRVYYGTAGRDDDLLQRIKQTNLHLERRDGIRRHFEYPWHVVAEHNPDYRLFVESARERLGPNHPTFLSQYELRPVAPRDALFEPTQIRQLQGEHARRLAPEPDVTYVAGVDVAGPAELVRDPNQPVPRADRDSTVIAIAEIDRSQQFPTYPFGDYSSRATLPAIRVVQLVEWRGHSHQAQYQDLLQLLDATWHCRAIAFDATGLGQAPAEFLQACLGSRLQPVAFSHQRKSELGYELLAAANAGRLKLYAGAEDDLESRACWSQLRATRRVIHPGGLMSWSAQHGHDDYVTALSLVLHAARFPVEHAAAMVHAPHPYADEERDVPLSRRLDWLRQDRSRY